MSRFRDDGALKPVGLALTAVLAGLSGSAVGMAAQAEQVRALTPDNMLDAARDEDPTLLLGPSEPVEPFAEQAPELADPFA